VLTDPPFSRMDLVSCRNVMIYMEAALQRKLLLTLHYALKPQGFLFLGPSETIGSSRELFEQEDVKHKVFSKRAAPLRPEQAFPLAPSTPLSHERRVERWGEQPRDVNAEIQREADRVLLTRYVPAGVLVNGEGEIVQFRGDTGLYLTPAPGKASLNVLKMAREGLLVSLRALLQRARREGTVVREQGVRIRTNGGFTEVVLVVIPVARANGDERGYWVLFESAAPADAAVEKQLGRARATAGMARRIEVQEKEVKRLLQELAATRDYLQSVIEQQEAVN